MAVRPRCSATAAVLLIITFAARNAAASEELFVPKGPFTVDAWTNTTAPWFTYPEVTPSSAYYLEALATRPNFGIALSGGGYRAVTTGLGYIRGLHELGVLSKARYMSSNSGGSWLNAAFSYQDALPLSEFLGPYMAPQNLTLASLKSVADKEHGDFAAVISAATIRLKAATSGLLSAFTGESDVTKTGGWTTAIGIAFLDPYNLSAEQSTFSTNGTKGPIHEAAAGLGIPIYYYQGAVDRQAADKQPRPFPIIVGSVRSALSRQATFYPMEFTPEYVGVPPAATYSVEVEPPGNIEIIGGGLVEPLGLNSLPTQLPTLPAALQGSSAELTEALTDSTAASNTTIPPTLSGKHRKLLQNSVAGVPTGAVIAAKDAAAANITAAGAAASLAAAAAGGADKNDLLPIKVSVQSAGVVPLKATAGISSGAFAQGLGMLPGTAAMALKQFVGTERLELWNQVDFKGYKLDFTDGGGSDNYAITPLIRRKVRVVIACIANEDVLSRKRTLTELASDMFEISSFFGATPKTPLGYGLFGFDAASYNKKQIFPREGWDRLIEGLLNTTESGGPTHHLDEYEVRENKGYAVHGGWKVKVLWVLNAKQSSWEQQLPTEVTQLLAATRKELKRAEMKAAGITAAAVNDAGLDDFPYIPTSNADYTPELTGMLSQQTTWQMVQLKPMIDKLLQDAAADSTTAASQSG